MAARTVFNIANDFDKSVVSRISFQLPTPHTYDADNQSLSNRATGRSFRVGTLEGGLGSISVTGAKLYYQDVKNTHQLYVHEIGMPMSKPTYHLKFFVKLSARLELWLNCTSDFLPDLNEAQKIVDICKTAQLK